MKVLIACEESQVICKAFRSRGHNAFSCDIQDCSGGHPEWHLKCDVRDLLGEYYDLVIFHPVCKYLAHSGVQWLYTEEGRFDLMRRGAEFFNLRHRFNSPRVATENPVPHHYAVELIGNYDQLVNPWQFGHKVMKKTCFWLKGLPPLVATNVVGPPPKDRRERYEWQTVFRVPPGPDRERIRSKTFEGIADAIADQWGSLQ
jgi:hypothetical protein